MYSSSLPSKYRPRGSARPSGSTAGSSAFPTSSSALSSGLFPSLGSGSLLDGDPFGDLSSNRLNFNSSKYEPSALAGSKYEPTGKYDSPAASSTSKYDIHSSPYAPSSSSYSSNYGQNAYSSQYSSSAQNQFPTNYSQSPYSPGFPKTKEDSPPSRQPHLSSPQPSTSTRTSHLSSPPPVGSRSNRRNSDDPRLPDPTQIPSVRDSWASGYLRKRRETQIEEPKPSTSTETPTTSTTVTRLSAIPTPEAQNSQSEFMQRLLSAHRVVDELLSKRGLRGEDEAKYLKTVEWAPPIVEEEQRRPMGRARRSLSSESDSGFSMESDHSGQRDVRRHEPIIEECEIEAEEADFRKTEETEICDFSVLIYSSTEVEKTVHLEAKTKTPERIEHSAGFEKPPQKEKVFGRVSKPTECSVEATIRAKNPTKPKPAHSRRIILQSQKTQKPERIVVKLQKKEKEEPKSEIVKTKKELDEVLMKAKHIQRTLLDCPKSAEPEKIVVKLPKAAEPKETQKIIQNHPKAADPERIVVKLPKKSEPKEIQQIIFQIPKPAEPERISVKLPKKPEPKSVQQTLPQNPKPTEAEKIILKLPTAPNPKEETQQKEESNKKKTEEKKVGKLGDRSIQIEETERKQRKVGKLQIPEPPAEESEPVKRPTPKKLQIGESLPYSHRTMNARFQQKPPFGCGTEISVQHCSFYDVTRSIQEPREKWVRIHFRLTNRFEENSSTQTNWMAQNSTVSISKKFLAKPSAMERLRFASEIQSIRGNLRRIPRLPKAQPKIDVRKKKVKKRRQPKADGRKNAELGKSPQNLSTSASFSSTGSGGSSRKAASVKSSESRRSKEEKKPNQRRLRHDEPTFIEEWERRLIEQFRRKLHIPVLNTIYRQIFCAKCRLCHLIEPARGPIRAFFINRPVPEQWSLSNLQPEEFHRLYAIWKKVRISTAAHRGPISHYTLGNPFGISLRRVNPKQRRPFIPMSKRKPKRMWIPRWRQPQSDGIQRSELFDIEEPNEESKEALELSQS